MALDEKFMAQLIAELQSAQVHALRALASAVADTTCGRARLAEALETHSARLQHAQPHPTAQEWIEAVIRDLHGDRD